MKINIRSTEQLQRKIDKHVRRIEIAGRAFGRYHHRRPRSRNFATCTLPKLYEVVRRSKVPMDYRAATGALGLPQTTFYHFPVSGRLSLLAKEGYLKVVGEGPLRYHWNHGAKLYAANPLSEVPRVQRRLNRAIANMIAEVEPLTQLAIDAPICLAQRIAANENRNRQYETWNPNRDAEIIRLRISGMSLTELGLRFGITRERCRQIVERAVIGRKGYSVQIMERAHRVPMATIKARDWPEAAKELTDEQLALDIIQNQLKR